MDRDEIEGFVQAAGKNDIDTVKSMLQANPLLHGHTALMKASTGGHLRMVEFLLDKGADINAKDTEGLTALMCACRQRHTSIVEALLDRGADIHASKKTGDTAFTYACRFNHIDAVHLLLNKGADIHANMQSRDTALMWASFNGALPVVELLLNLGADVNAKAHDNDTALMFASRQGRADVVQLLLDNGADINVKNNHGFTALMVACEKDRVSVVEVLLKYGADVNAANATGMTAFKVTNNKEIRQMLNQAKEMTHISPAAAPITAAERNSKTVSQPPAAAPVTASERNSEDQSAAIQAALQQGGKEWSRSRIMLVGQGRAGKTALCNSLIGKGYQETESTVGINQLMCDIHYASSGSKGWHEYTKPVKELEAAVASMLAKAKQQQKKPMMASTDSVPDIDDSVVSTIAVNTSKAKPTAQSTADKSTVSSRDPIATSSPQRIAPPVIPSVNEELVMQCLASSIATESDLVVSLFDYGGQSVFNVIHHLFLTQNGVYVLAFNMEWLLSDGEEKEQCLSYLRFWTNSIWIHTHNTATGRAAPIALVGTRKDRVVNPKEHERISTLLFETFAHTKIWPSVLSNKQGQGINGTTLLYFYPVDNTRGRDDVTVCQLLTKLEEAMNGNAFTHKKVPLSWLRAVDEMQASGKSCLSLETVHDIAVRKCGVSQDHVPYLLHFLHEMGIALWHDEPGLREVVILDAVSYLVVPATRVICKHVPDSSDGISHMLDVHTDCSQQYFNEWVQLTTKGVLDEVMLDVLWRDVMPERDMLLKLMVKFGLLVPVSSLSRKNQDAESGSSKKHIVPALLPRVDPTSVAMREWTDKPHQTCLFVFSASSDLGENSVLLQHDIMRDGFLPTGLFERIVGKVISWSLATARAGKFNIRNVTLHRELAILSFGTQRFRLTLCPQINSIRVDIEGMNPLVVQDRLLYLIEVVMKECMRSLHCFAAVLYSPATTSSAIPVLDVESFCFGNNDALLLLPLDSIRSAAESRSVLTLPGGRNLMTESDAKSLFEVWLKVSGQQDRYDVFISYRWGDFDGAFVSGLFDMFTNYTIGATSRSIDVFLDKKRLKEGRQFDADFAMALTRSVVVLPMISPEALQRLITHDASAVDNVLLEWILSLQCYNNASCRTKAVFPFAFGSRSFNESNEVIVQSLFASDVLNKLPHVVPTATLERGAKLLKENQVTVADMDAYRSLTVHSIVTELMKFLCFQSWSYDAGDVLEEGADKVLEVLRGVPEQDAIMQKGNADNVIGDSSSCDVIWSLLHDNNSVTDMSALKNILSEAKVTCTRDVLNLSSNLLDRIASLLNPVACIKWQMLVAWDLLQCTSTDAAVMQATLQELGIESETQLSDVDDEMVDQITALLKPIQRKKFKKLLQATNDV